MTTGLAASGFGESQEPHSITWLELRTSQPQGILSIMPSRQLLTPLSSVLKIAWESIPRPLLTCIYQETGKRDK